ncbi:MAG TPA: EAL domain-containing protein [Nevskiaceae bacterium]
MVGLTIAPAQLTEHTQRGLLVLARTEEPALQIERCLRNSGYPLRTVWVSDLAALDRALRDNPPDLLLCEAQVEGAPFLQVVDRCRRVQPELPLVQINDTVDATTSADALAAGAQDCISTHDELHLRHLEYVILREILNYDRVRDLTRARERLAESELRHRQLTESTGEAVARIQEGILVEANAPFAKLLGHENPESLRGTPLVDMVVTEQRAEIKTRLRMIMRGRHSGDSVTMVLQGASGPVEVKAQMILSNIGGEGAIDMLVPHATEAPVARAASGAPARGYAAFASALRGSAPDERLQLALVLKLDGRPALERRIGPIGAETICQQATDDIREHLEPDDVLLALAGDELGISARRRSAADVKAFADGLRTGIAQRKFKTGDDEIQLSLSIAARPVDADDDEAALINELTSTARQLSMGGGNRTQVLGVTKVAAGAVSSAARADSRSASDIRAALEDGRMKLVLQQISSLDDPSVMLYDVLLRMTDHDGSILHAGKVLPQAQRVGMMRAVDRWVLTRAIELVGKSSASPILFTKVSSASLADGDAFVRWIRSLLSANHALRPESMVFELRTGDAQAHLETSHYVVEALNEMGFSVALEHFGLDAAPFKLLEHVCARYLKVHPDFVERFDEPGIRERLHALLKGAQDNGLKTIIPRVDSAERMATLWQLGANFVQGVETVPAEQRFS